MDEGSYWARVRRIAAMMDIRTAFVTDAQIAGAQDVLKRTAGGDASLAEADVRTACRIVNATTHPGRFQNIGAQWLNQTYNSLHYYANRNATNSEDSYEIFQAYLGATGGSVAVAVGLNSMLDKVPPGRRWAPIVRRLVPFCAVAAADVLNLGIMRKNEFLEGVRVSGPDGEELGKSRVAGAYAVGACIGGRIAAAAPILIGPPLLLHRLEDSPIFLKRPWLKTATLMGLIGVSIQVCVPLFFGMFKQQAEADVDSLEDQFHHLVDSQGLPIKQVTYNKGI